ALERLVTSGALANEATLAQVDGHWSGTGDMVDISFLALAHKFGTDPVRLARQTPRVAQIPYESELAFAASLNRVDGHFELHVKGALEKILTMCGQTTSGVALDHQAVLTRASAMAADGYRILAVARATLDAVPEPLSAALTDLDFAGFVGIIDPVRPEAVYALEKTRAASIETAMVTGDHPQTALAIARELGLVSAGAGVVVGNELDEASASGDAALDELIRGHRVFARISPVQKSLIVDRLIAQGHNVAVTGDGVNDAPALRRAHVGVAMGERGTDVARESADLILTDDNFAAIVNGVREGRVVYSNIRKVIFLLISTGAAEITLFLWSLSFGLPLPLFPIQLLWLNLVTNGVQDVALAFEPPEGDELARPPRRPQEPIFDGLMVERVLMNAVFMGSIAFAVFFFVYTGGATETEARNTTLLLMVLFENVHALNSRSERASLFSLRFFGNPLLIGGILIAQSIHIGSMYLPGISTILEISPVSMQTWLELLGVALLLLFFDEAHKFRLRRHPQRTR
ncbi:MAG: cation-translocating P-type ATPase, partial [Gammaproteobacteria bacterium]